MARKKKLSFEQMLKNLEGIVAQQNVINGKVKSKSGSNPTKTTSRKVIFA